MRKSLNKIFAGIGIFSALSYLVSFWEIPIFAAAPFLKLDFSSTFSLLAGFVYGPLGGVAVCVIKELLVFFTKSTTGGIGEIANVIMTTGFIILPTLVYRFKKGLPTVIVTLIIGCLIQTATALITNRYINFPLYMGESAESVFLSVWQFIVYFNLIKTFSVSAITVLIYKRVSKIIGKI